MFTLRNRQLAGIAFFFVIALLLWSCGAKNYIPSSPNPTAPSFTVQPTNQIVTVGMSATFSATATGSAPLMYQWQENKNDGAGWTNIPNETTLSYEVKITVAGAAKYQYRVGVY